MKHVIAQSQRRKTVYGIIFVVEIEQKQAMCLNVSLLINFLFFLTVVKSKTTGLCNHGDFLRKTAFFMWCWLTRLNYINIYIFCFYIFNFVIILNAF